MDKAATHDPSAIHRNFKMLLLPPNTTAVYQPLDGGIIAAVKRGYKTRLLAGVVAELNEHLRF